MQATLREKVAVSHEDRSQTGVKGCSQYAILTIGLPFGSAGSASLGGSKISGQNRPGAVIFGPLPHWRL